ncbi:unnamed protein product [Phaedon cochleariae]|uniref:Gamma-tubulin complex component 6 n=1 Tax=Phaedon cochleariae TaxID=80249 RepID=A0A9P0DFZ7_PHACE|nr:unnamed protein product [Phaedon cochleariae]
MDSEDENTDSVFKLITSLCETFHNNPAEINKSRSKCYEILLGKRIPNHPIKFKDLEGTTDPFCNYLSWQFVLTHDYDLRDHAEKLQTCIEDVQECYQSNNKDDFNNILKFLLSFRNIPTKDKTILDLSSLPSLDEYENFNSLFQLPQSVLKEFDDFGHYDLNEKPSTSNALLAKDSKDSLQTEFPGEKFEVFNDEGYFSPSKTPEINIWELASKSKYCDRRNWESYGYPEPDKERPFLSELGALSSLWVENLESLYMFKLFKDGTVFNSRMRPRKAFIKDSKYLLVGMASESFTFDDNGEFYLVPGISVDGIAPDTLNRYCRDLTFSGTCYKALSKMSAPNLDTGINKCQGYIFKEFCESISRYLEFHRTAAFNIPDSIHFLQFHEKTRQLQWQIATLASICKVGSFHRAEDIPHGVALLNYLYQKVLTLTDEKTISVLYSILYPCCQIYFSRFLKQWILEGVIEDPYGEFFIKPNLKYIISRGRTYWTRSYSIREDIIPDFLIDLKMDILFCGKSMSLLKFCDYSNNLRIYLMGKKPSIISCCLTLDQLATLQQNTTNYYLDVCEECGPRFNLREVLLKSHQYDSALLGLIAKKRATTLKKLELERQKRSMEQNEKKLEEINSLREQYDAAMEQKQLRIAREIEEDMRQEEENLAIELKRQKLIHEEADKLIDYYSKLCKTADNKKSEIDIYVKKIQSIHIEPNILTTIEEKSKSFENLAETSSADSFYSIPEHTEKEANTNEAKVEKMEIEVEHHLTNMNSSESLDIINANIGDGNQNESTDKNANSNIQQAKENFATARRIKHKVMTQEMGIDYGENPMTKTADVPRTTYLTDAQKNKLKILSTEFGIELAPELSMPERVQSAQMVNRNRVMGISDCFAHKVLDNENFVNKNLRNIEENSNGTGAVKKSKSLLLDLDRVSLKSARSDTDRPIPMSVDSTPMSDLPHSGATTPSTMFLSIDTNHLESIPNTAETHQTDEGFHFEQQKELPVVQIYSSQKQSEEKPQEKVFSKRVTRKQAAGVTTNCLKLFLHESMQIPLVAQIKLINNELLRYFIEDLGYLTHLHSLRDYFFLQDGEFARNITDNLFHKLYESAAPSELINCRILQDLMFGAMDMSCRNQSNTHFLSFRINSLPSCFDLGDPSVLDCLSLTYRVQWPLNVLLPTDTVGKYDEVFKFLLKLNRLSWVLKKTFLELKALAKETGKKEIYLMSSPQYRRLHQCRHIMTHFVQTLRNYVVGEVLQSSWTLFEKNLENVNNLDELYAAHTAYIKNILFMCLLNQKSLVLRSVLHKTFIVILKFFDYLRSRSWTCEDGEYVHPNFDKLESIFKNFQEFVTFFFKTARKISRSGYQPHLIQLLEMLDMNGYVSKFVV